MTDIVVNGTISPPGGVITLDQPNQRLISGSTSIATVRGGAYLSSTAVGAVIDPLIRFVPDGTFAAAGVVQCAASNARINCTIDCNGMPVQGVQLIRYPSTAQDPRAVNLDQLWVYNNAMNPTDVDVGYNHGVYLQDSIGTTGKNMRFTDIRGGRALHFYPRSTTSLLTNITCVRCYGDVVFWGSAVTLNQVLKLSTFDGGAKTSENYGGGAGTSNVLDRVLNSAPPGYGYQPPVPSARDVEPLLRQALDLLAKMP